MGFQTFEPGENTSQMILEDPADEVGRDPPIIEVELTQHWGASTGAMDMLPRPGLR